MADEPSTSESYRRRMFGDLKPIRNRPNLEGVERVRSYINSQRDALEEIRQEYGGGMPRAPRGKSLAPEERHAVEQEAIRRLRMELDDRERARAAIVPPEAVYQMVWVPGHWSHAPSGASMYVHGHYRAATPEELAQRRGGRF